MTDRKSTTPELDDTMSLSEARPLSAVRTTGGGHGRDSSPASITTEKLAGRYELLALLGSGGMGTVYRARDITLDEVVALKVLREELASDPSMLARFRQEVKLARKVTHANVARTFDIGEHGPHTFLTMELIEGTSLADALTDAVPLPMQRAIEIANGMCAGLGAAHSAGIVHRDLKPENVLLATDGRVVITDFGIARAMAPSAVRTQGAAVGTPAYMAPEQVEGAPDLDARADIYALGAILFEMWTGCRAWEGESIYVIASRRLFEPPPDPRARCRDLPDQAARVVMRCMATARGDRFQNVGDVATALSRISLGGSLAQAGRLVSPPYAVAERAGVVERRPFAAPVKSVAVLPFRNRGTPADEYLADGLTEDLIDLLSVTDGLRVCARGVVVQRAPLGQDPREVGQSLGVQVVVEGSVRRTNGRLRVTVRVVSVGDGFQVWATRLDNAESEFFDVSDTLARAVAEALTCRVLGAPREAPTDPIALDLYLRARHEYHKLWGDNLLAAIALYKQALERAPNDPMILAGYAMAVARHCGFNEGDDEQAEASRLAAEQAVAAAPHLAAARVARACQRNLYGEGVLAGRDLREVLVSSPDAVDGLDLSGHLLAEAGALDEGLARLKRTLELEPGQAGLPYDIARLLALRGDRDESEAFFGEEPDHPGLSNVYWINRARVAFWQRDVERARAWRASLATKTHVFPSVIGILQIVIGETPPPELLHHVLAQGRSGTPLLRRRAFYSMIAAEFADQDELALDAIESADAARVFDLTWFDLCPALERIRRAPRFVAVHARVIERAAEVRRAIGV